MRRVGRRLAPLGARGVVVLAAVAAFVLGPSIAPAAAPAKSKAKQTKPAASKTKPASPAPKPSTTATAPVAGLFVYPVGDEIDYSRPHDGETYGFYVSDPYLAVRSKRKSKRTHFGVDLANGRGGYGVRSVASGVVVVADANARIKVKKKVTTKVPVVKDGKKTTVTKTTWKTSWKWRTGWGNHVVVRHTLPSGETIFSLYGHLMPKSVTVKVGDVVAAGQQVGKVGRTGRASSSHLHLEIRKTIPAEGENPMENGGAEGGGGNGAEEAPPARVQPELRSFRTVSTIDPMPFLSEHVRSFEDLEAGTWERRYAMAACRDGLMIGDRDRFRPDKPITREDFYSALVTAFQFATPFTTQQWTSVCDALVDVGVLDAKSVRGQDGDDRLTRSDALEILLRCLDKSAARAPNLASIDAMLVSRDFNREFAGPDAAVAAEAKAKSIANAETKALVNAEYNRVARARKAAKAQGKVSKAKVKKVSPVKPKPLLDPGIEAFAQSDQNLTRAESCLLLATAVRLARARYSALEEAATRVANSG